MTLNITALPVSLGLGSPSPLPHQRIRALQRQGRPTEPGLRASRRPQRASRPPPARCAGARSRGWPMARAAHVALCVYVWCASSIVVEATACSQSLSKRCSCHAAAMRTCYVASSAAVMQSPCAHVGAVQLS
eukprot:356130-Chlamydomonas_euryale.AAC.3